jgi:hypothetical protein
MSTETHAAGTSNERQIREFFARLEQESPGVVKAMKEMNISYQQYLIGLLALSRPVMSSSNSLKFTL